MQHYTFRILHFSNYDGDSFDLTLDLGFSLTTHKKVRILGVDTPELRGGTDDSKAAGRLARLRASEWVDDAMSRGNAYFSSQGYAGKFGRPLGDIVDEDGSSLVEFLLSQRLAVPYEAGQAKAKVQELHDANIEYLKSTGAI